MSAFNHRIKPFEGKETAPTVIGENIYRNGDFCQSCKPYSLNGKKVLAAYEGRYDYVTGRAGRVSWKSFFLCQEHGEKFIKKHKLSRAEGTPVDDLLGGGK